MKLRIGAEEVLQLTPEQRRNLTEMWIPEKYDLALAFACRDIATGEYDAFEIVVGGIALHGTSVYISDMSAPTVYTNGCAETDTEEYPEEDFSEDEMESNYERPSVFNKQDCVPLLNIGQMIALLERNNFGKYDFFVSVCTLENYCELGRSGASWEGLSDYQPAELCDVLWESLKALL